jgi:hypothetical protein
MDHLKQHSRNPIHGSANTTLIDTVIFEGVIPNLPANVIAVEQTIAALGRSGPAVY